jgi:hypothetical protein
VVVVPLMTDLQQAFPSDCLLAFLSTSVTLLPLPQ